MPSTATTYRPPPCKSSLQRALLLAFLCEGRTDVGLPDGGRLADDPRVLIGCLRQLGAAVELDPAMSEADGRTLRVTGSGWPSGVDTRLYVGMNATALRCLTALCGCLGGRVHLRGKRELRRRSLFDLPQLLQARGATFAFEGEPGHMPFLLEAPVPSAAQRFAPDLTRTSQVATGLALALAASKHGGTLELDGPLSYLGLTATWLRRFGCDFELERVTEIPGGSLRSPGSVQVPTDPSSAAWMLALGGGLGTPVRIAGLDLHSGHPDLGIAADLVALGYKIAVEDGVLTLRGEPGEGDYEIDSLDDCPDLFPPLVALLSARPGKHRLASRKLRGKESDRIGVLARGLARLGFDVEEEPHGLKLTGLWPGTHEAPAGIRLDPKQDHRMAMAFGVIRKLHGFDVRIRDASCVDKSWPDFWRFLEGFG